MMYFAPIPTAADCVRAYKLVASNNELRIVFFPHTMYNNIIYVRRRNTIITRVTI